MIKKNNVIPQKKFHVKKDDEVKVISGASRGQTGKILKVLREKNRVLVEGINIVKKHKKPSAKNTQGGIVEEEASIHISNVKKIKEASTKTSQA